MRKENVTAATLKKTKLTSFSLSAVRVEHSFNVPFFELNYNNYNNPLNNFYNLNFFVIK